LADALGVKEFAAGEKAPVPTKNNSD